MLASPAETPEREAFVEWLRFAEGTAMTLVVAALLPRHTATAATEGVTPFFGPELDQVLCHLKLTVAIKPYLLASGFSGDDTMNDYVNFTVEHAGGLGAFHGLIGYRDRLLSYPALQRPIAVDGLIFPVQANA